MHKIILIIILLALSGCQSVVKKESTPTVTNSQQKKEIYADKKYKDFLQFVLQAGDHINIEDINKLRELYTDTSHYHPYLSSESMLVRSTFELLPRKKWKTCIANVEKIISIEYTNLNAHYLAMVCYEKMKNEQKSKMHLDLVNKIIDAIWDTGDGKTLQTAFYTYSTPELQAFLQLQGLSIIGQSLHNGKEGIFDVMKVRDPASKKEFSLYFNISKQWQKGFKNMGKTKTLEE